MAVEANPFEDEDEELSVEYPFVLEKNGFVRQNIHPARKQRDATRRVYSGRSLNCGDENPFARECPAKYLNRSALIHPLLVMVRRKRPKSTATDRNIFCVSAYKSVPTDTLAILGNAMAGCPGWWNYCSSDTHHPSW